jgi:hypothetical protein
MQYDDIRSYVFFQENPLQGRNQILVQMRKLKKIFFHDGRSSVYSFLERSHGGRLLTSRGWAPFVEVHRMYRYVTMF